MKKKIIEFLKNNNIEIPENDDDIVNLFFGSGVIENMDYWLNWCYDFIDNSEPSVSYARINEQAKQDMAYRSTFSELNDKSKEHIKKLIKEMIEGIMFSFLLKMDQPEIGEWKITLETEDGKKIGNVNNNDDLHEKLYYWMELFNKNN